MNRLATTLRRLLAGALCAGALAVPATLVASSTGAALASASACSSSLGASGCAISTDVTILGGTLGVQSSPSLSWSYLIDGYDQWSSASASALSSCQATADGTTCSGGTAPELEVIDATGAGAGWSLSAYLSGSDLPSGSLLSFDGAGSSSFGSSTDASLALDPFAATTPATACDYASTCALPSPPASCSHVGLGITSCPDYPVNLTTATGAADQVDLYSAAASTGRGAICVASGSASASGCVGTSPADFYNVGIPANANVGNFAATVINLTVSSGP